MDSVQSQLSPDSKLLVVCQEGLRLVFAAYLPYQFEGQ